MLYRIRPFLARPAAALFIRGVASIMPFSTYLPEHMGSITLSPPGPFEAGSNVELTLTYTAGTFGIDDTGMLKISWRTTSDMSKPQFDKPSRTELHHGRGEQRRQARSLVRPAQYPALGQHAAHPSGPRISARGRHADHPAGRPPSWLARLPPADQLRGARRAQDFGRRFRHLRVHRAAATARVRAGRGRSNALESALAVIGRRRRAVPPCNPGRGHVGQPDGAGR